MPSRTMLARAAGTIVLALALTPWLAAGPAAALTKADADISVKSTQVPTTAAGFASKESDCPGYAPGEPYDYFHFVLDGNDHAFVELVAEFGADRVTLTTFGPPTAKHAYVKVLAGATLTDAYADVTPDEDVPSDFQLSHVCVGTPVTPTPTTTTSTPAQTTSTPAQTTSTPAQTTSTPAQTTSTPAQTTTTATIPAGTPATPTTAPATTSTGEASVLPTKIGSDDEEETSDPADTEVAVAGVKRGTADVLPDTGASVGLLVAVGLGLLLGGAALAASPAAVAARRGRRLSRHVRRH